MPAAVVLYEDSQRKNEFVPHRFVRACVQDKTSLQPGFIENALDPRPMNGINAIIRAVGEGHNVARRGEEVIALVDGDRIRDHLPALKVGATAAEVQAELCKLAAPRFEFRLFVLDRNLESVLKAVAECFAAHEDICGPAGKSLGKNRLERDLALRRASKRELNSERACVLKTVPSFACFIDHLATLCRDAFSETAQQ